MRISIDRVQKLIEVFKELGLRGVKIFEDLDVQMEAAKLIEKNCKGLSPLTLYINAIVSYMIPQVGEKYWLDFANFIISDCPRGFDEVIDRVIHYVNSRHKFCISTKISRLRLLRNCKYILEPLKERNMLTLWRATAKCLNADLNSKTIVFAVKMAYYGYRAQDIDMVLPFEIPIPVDRRVAKITYLSGAIEGIDLRQISSLSPKIAKAIRGLWFEISKTCEIPSLHIDAVLWTMGRYTNLKTKNEVLQNIDKRILNLLGKNMVKKLIENLFYRLD